MTWSDGSTPGRGAMVESEVSEVPARASAISRIEWARDVGKVVKPSMKARAVLVIMATYANTKTGVAWPSLERVADDTGWSQSSVKRAVVELMTLGLIVDRKRRKDSSSMYLLAGVKTGWKMPESAVGTGQCDLNEQAPVTYEPCISEPCIEPLSSPYTDDKEQREPGKEKPASLSQIQLVGSILREKGKTWEDVRSAWRGIVGVQQGPPVSF